MAAEVVRGSSGSSTASRGETVWTYGFFGLLLAAPVQSLALEIGLRRGQTKDQDSCEEKEQVLHDDERLSSLQADK